MKRFVIEGEWSGYTSSQRRIVHRTVHKDCFKYLRKWAENNHSITYTDGTALHISVRDAKHRERVKEIHGYDSLISDCAYYNVNRVSDLPKHKSGD